MPLPLPACLRMCSSATAPLRHHGCAMQLSCASSTGLDLLIVALRRPAPPSSEQLVRESSEQEEAAMTGQLPQDISWGPLVFEARRFVELRKKTFSGRAGL